MLEIGAILACYNTYNQNDIYFQISKSILENYNNIDMSNIEACADYLHISVSTLNRFIRQLYYSNFSDFRCHISKSEENYHYDGKYFPAVTEKIVTPSEYGKILCDNISETMNELDQNSIESLVSMIKSSKEIIFIGIQITSEVWRLQKDLIFMGKKTSAFLDPNFQVNAINNVTSESLVICLQYNRQEDNHNEMLIMNAKSKGAKIAYIGNIKVRSIEQNADLSITYRGTNTNLDTNVIQTILNYIGTYLRNTIMC